jgi:hypothetical protein
MTRTQKRIFGLLLLMAAVVFVIFIFPNARATDNLAMVQMFQPDEAAPLPYVFNMIAPAESLEKALRAFVFYDYYYYGFPYFSLSALTLLPLQWLGGGDAIGDSLAAPGGQRAAAAGGTFAAGLHAGSFPYLSFANSVRFFAHCPSGGVE